MREKLKIYKNLCVNIFAMANEVVYCAQLMNFEGKIIWEHIQT